MSDSQGIPWLWGGRENNDAAELVLEQLDTQWFSNNVVRWPSVPITRALHPPRSRRLSDGDHHLRRYLDPAPRRLSDIFQTNFSSPRPPSGPLMGVTEDEEMENSLFAKMLANRPAKLTTINPGRSSLAPLQENQTKLGTPERMFPGLHRQGIPPYNSFPHHNNDHNSPAQNLLWP
jgi:hypothetical protein